MRSIFSAGLLDGFLDRDFHPFHLCTGISAGAANLVAYLGNRRGSSLHLFDTVCLNPNFICYRRFVTGGHLIDLDWLETQAYASAGLDPLSVFDSTASLFIGVTDVHSGKTKYELANTLNIHALLKASAALPVFYRQFPKVDGKTLADGGIGTGNPVADAIGRGATRIMVVRSRHHTYQKKDTPMHRWLRHKMRTHPALRAAMDQRVETHMQTNRWIRQPPKGIQVVEVCPPADFNTGRFSRNRRILLAGYKYGLDAADGAIRRWEGDS